MRFARITLAILLCVVALASTYAHDAELRLAKCDVVKAYLPHSKKLDAADSLIRSSHKDLVRDKKALAEKQKHLADTTKKINEHTALVAKLSALTTRTPEQETELSNLNGSVISNEQSLSTKLTTEISNLQTSIATSQKAFEAAKKDIAEIRAITTAAREASKESWTIHGLWPKKNFLNSSEPFDAKKIRHIADLETQWKSCLNSNPTNFHRGQWNRRGRHSGLEMVDYFTQAVMLAKTHAKLCDANPRPKGVILRASGECSINLDHNAKYDLAVETAAAATHIEKLEKSVLTQAKLQTQAANAAAAAVAPPAPADAAAAAAADAAAAPAAAAAAPVAAAAAAPVAAAPVAAAGAFAETGRNRLNRVHQAFRRSVSLAEVSAESEDAPAPKSGSIFSRARSAVASVGSKVAAVGGKVVGTAAINVCAAKALLTPAAGQAVRDALAGSSVSAPPAVQNAANAFSEAANKAAATVQAVQTAGSNAIKNGQAAVAGVRAAVTNVRNVAVNTANSVRNTVNNVRNAVNNAAAGSFLEVEADIHAEFELEAEAEAEPTQAAITKALTELTTCLRGAGFSVDDQNKARVAASRVVPLLATNALNAAISNAENAVKGAAANLKNKATSTFSSVKAKFDAAKAKVDAARSF